MDSPKKMWRDSPRDLRVLDDLIQSKKVRQQRTSIEMAISEYYSSLSEAEIAEQKSWGQFATEQLIPEPHSDE